LCHFAAVEHVLEFWATLAPRVSVHMSWWWPSSASKIHGDWSGELWLGGYQCATKAGSWDLIVNCADLDYPYDQVASRFWLHIAYGDAWGPYEQNNQAISWQGRMEAALQIVLYFLTHGFRVLIHCRQGKHRASAFTVAFLYVFWCGRWSWEQAIDWVVQARGLHRGDVRMTVI